MMEYEMNIGHWVDRHTSNTISDFRFDTLYLPSTATTSRGSFYIPKERNNAPTLINNTHLDVHISIYQLAQIYIVFQTSLLS